MSTGHCDKIKDHGSKLAKAPGASKESRKVFYHRIRPDDDEPAVWLHPSYVHGRCPTGSLGRIEMVEETVFGEVRRTPNFYPE